MSGYVLPGVIGLLLGLCLRWTQLCCPAALRTALAWRVSHALRSLLYFLGAGMMLTALLMWLAVIDVDGVVVLPLSLGVLLGGAVFGVAVALSGFTPLTAFAGVGGGQPLEAMCVLAGCLAGALLLPLLEAPLAALQALPPLSASTLFRTTLDEPFLLGGGFLAQGCAGALLTVIAACIPSNRRERSKEEAADAVPADEAGTVASEPEAVGPDAISVLPLLLPPPGETIGPEDGSPPPESAPEETFIALLPGEEPLVVDTALDDGADEASADEGEKERHEPDASPAD